MIVRDRRSGNNIHRNGRKESWVNGGESREVREADLIADRSRPQAGNNEECTATFRANNDTKVCVSEVRGSQQDARPGVEGNAAIENPPKDFHGLDVFDIRPQVPLHDLLLLAI